MRDRRRSDTGERRAPPAQPTGPSIAAVGRARPRGAAPAPPGPPQGRHCRSITASPAGSPVRAAPSLGALDRPEASTVGEPPTAAGERHAPPAIDEESEKAPETGKLRGRRRSPVPPAAASARSGAGDRGAQHAFPVVRPVRHARAV